MPRPKFAYRSVNEIEIAQRIDDGFINGTAMCKAHGKDITQWFRTKDTFELFCAVQCINFPTTQFNSVNLQDLDVSRLSGSKYEKIFPSLISTKRGSPETGGGTWLHRDLAVPLAEWCNKFFAVQVSHWVQQWMVEHHNPITRQQLLRFESREDLKHKARKELVGQIRCYLEAIKRYVAGYREGYFREVHDAINIAITGETAGQMRARLSKQLGVKITKKDLIRDYFPTDYLQSYISMCYVTANLIRVGYDPLSAVETAITLALPHAYIPRPIQVFEESTEVLEEKKDKLLKQLPASTVFALT